MAYIFRGFFAHLLENDENDENDLLSQRMIQAVRQQWPTASARFITDPFFGIGVQFPEGAESVFWDDQVFIEEDSSVLDWGRQFSGTTFVYIEADCFGGTCNYRGYVCRDGQLLHCETDDVDGAGPLIHLLRYLDIESAGYFAPFERGFFDTGDEE